MTSLFKHKASALQMLLLAAITLCISACSNDDSNGGPSQPGEAYWKISSTVNSAAGSSAIIITGTPGTQWSAEVTEGSAWCSFSSSDFVNSSSKTGEIKDGLNVLYVYYKANTGKEQRPAKVSFQFAGQEAKTFDLIQLSESQQNLPEFKAWAEIPEFKENANYQYVTHYVPLNNKTIRNYSICFDKSKKAALWVAYPIHTAYLKGTGGRTDLWAFDPIVPSNNQANCVDRSYGGNYDRGHQIASADRLGTDEMNAQTFYMTNMTPQLNRLNQDMWARLENKVRTYNCSDTLFVVTGAYFAPGSSTTTTDGKGNTVPLPTSYYKVLLRTKSGKTGKAVKDCSDDELISIGFWVDHKSYGNIEPPSSVCTTVADIESKTGFKFFPQVSNSVKQQRDLTTWGIN
ncbi:endonuclease G [Bacteroides reticulotermitis]|nr:DNA/RNA non-specific endonuclease [Bacteroides reticulotermitis]MBB4045199.1 endonuclease G [Bacteroides reticulotermitis]